MTTASPRRGVVAWLPVAEGHSVVEDGELSQPHGALAEGQGGVVQQKKLSTLGVEDGQQNPNDMSAVNAIYHIVINTYRREMTLPLLSSKNLYNYIAGVIRNKNCVVYAINGIENHIHILINLRPDVCLSDLVRDIKLGSNQWIKIHMASFPEFRGWGKEYGAFTYAMANLEIVRKYILNQREHHGRQTFDDEYRHLVEIAGVEWNDNRLT